MEKEGDATTNYAIQGNVEGKEQKPGTGKKMTEFIPR